MTQTPFNDDDSLSISRIMVVGESQRNPFAAPAEAAMRDFAQKWNVMQLPNFEHYCTMNSFLYPTASLERLAVMGKMSSLFFYIDDLAVSNPIDDANEVLTDSVIATSKQEELASLGFIFRTGQLPPAPTNLQQALCESRQEFLALCGENTDYISRCLDSAEQYLVKHSRPSAFVEKATDGTVDLQSYIVWRDDDSAMNLHIDLIEFANDFTLPETVVTHPTLLRLRRNCNRVAGLMNDIFSYHKEIVVEGNRFNLVNLIQENTGVGLKEAVEEAINIVNGYIVEFLEYEKQVPYWDTATQFAVNKYVEGMKSQISGSWHWQIYTLRYRSPESPFHELRSEA
jgi:hypothetical protein